MIKLTQQAENERVLKERENRRGSWEFFQSSSIVSALHKAKDMGWKDKKVQVRVLLTNSGEEYAVEPFERDCGCPNILKYEDFFD